MRSIRSSHLEDNITYRSFSKYSQKQLSLKKKSNKNLFRILKIDFLGNSRIVVYIESC